jgi:hypothetical protein
MLGWTGIRRAKARDIDFGRGERPTGRAPRNHKFGTSFAFFLFVGQFRAASGKRRKRKVIFGGIPGLNNRFAGPPSELSTERFWFSPTKLRPFFAYLNRKAKRINPRRKL